MQIYEGVYEKIVRNDDGVAVFWGPYVFRGTLPPDVLQVDKKYIRTGEGVVEILPGEGNTLPSVKAVWVAEKISPLVGKISGAQTTKNRGLLLETSIGTVEISEISGLWGVLFRTKAGMYVRIEADAIEKLPEVMRMILENKKIEYFQGVNIFCFF